MSKPALAYLLATDQVIQDVSSYKFSYLGLFQTINIPKETGFYYVDFSIVGRIYNAEKGEIKAEIRILDPDGKIFSKVSLSGSTDSGESHLYGRFNGIKFSQEGVYTYHLVYKNIVYELPGNKIEVFKG